MGKDIFYEPTSSEYSNSCNRQHIRHLIVVTILMVLVLPLRSQSCSQKLEEAKGSFYKGQLREVENILSSCLENGFDNEDQVEALRLLVNTQLLLNNTEQADLYMQELLTADPTYQVKESDLVEFKRLYETFEIRSNYTLGITTGVQLPDYIIMRYHSIAGRTAEPADYDEHPGFFIGLTGDARLFHNFFLNAAVLYDQKSFEQQEIILDLQSIYSSETQYRLNSSFQLRFIQPLRDWKIFAGGGYSFHYMAKAKGDFRHVPITQDFPIPFDGIPYFTEDFDITDQHNRLSHNVIGSIGIQKPMGKNIVELRFSYERGISNLINEDKRYSNDELLNKYAYVPDDVRVSTYYIGLTFYYNFSEPKKN